MGKPRLSISRATRDAIANCGWADSDAGVVVAIYALAVFAFVLAGVSPQSHDSAAGAYSPTPNESFGRLLAGSVPLFVAFIMTALRSLQDSRPVSLLLGFRDDARRHLRNALFGLIAGLVIIVPSMYLYAACSSLVEMAGLDTSPQSALTDIIESSASPFRFAMLAIGATVVAPLTEEIFFRRVLLSALMRRMSAPAAILASSFFFAAMHCHAGSFIPLFFVGACFAASAAATGTLTASLAMHSAFNAANIALALLLDRAPL